MKRIIIIFLLPLLLLLANAQEEKCTTCGVNQPTTTSDRLGDVYKDFKNSPLKDARVTILPVDLIVLADNIEITQPMLNDEMMKKSNVSKTIFKLVEELTVMNLILDKAKEWAGKKKLKIIEKDLVMKFQNSLTADLRIYDVEGKEYFNAHKTEYKGKEYAVVAKAIKKILLIKKKAIFIEKYNSELIKSYYIEINKEWLEKNIK